METKQRAWYAALRVHLHGVRKQALRLASGVGPHRAPRVASVVNGHAHHGARDLQTRAVTTLTRRRQGQPVLRRTVSASCSVTAHGRTAHTQVQARVPRLQEVSRARAGLRCHERRYLRTTGSSRPSGSSSAGSGVRCTFGATSITGTRMSREGALTCLVDAQPRPFRGQGALVKVVSEHAVPLHTENAVRAVEQGLRQAARVLGNSMVRSHWQLPV